jgi:hypothetical protein
MTPRDRYLRKTYGLSEFEYDRQLELQQGRCAICGDKPRGKRKLHVDHDHALKGRASVRGLICWRENTALRWLRDSPRIARAAAEYLEHHPFVLNGDMIVSTD